MVVTTFIFKLLPDFQITLAIMITIKYRSGKTGNRFFSQNRSAISGSELDRCFHFQTNPRLKTGSLIIYTDGASNRDSVFVHKQDPV